VAVRPVLRLPDPVLKQRAAEMGSIDDHLLADLVDTMRASPACVGLAAPQIGVARRALVVDVSEHPKATVSHGLLVLVDPVIVRADDREVAREGCMSVPDLTANVARARRLVVVGRGADGRDRVVDTEGFEARAMQHEIDHLDGILVVDRVTSARDLFQRRVYRPPRAE
jgi:peptide deformylase